MRHSRRESTRRPRPRTLPHLADHHPDRQPSQHRPTPGRPTRRARALTPPTSRKPPDRQHRPGLRPAHPRHHRTLTREQLTDHLSSWLGQACPKAVPKLRGAWHALTSNGPDAASQAANSGVEALDWTLRTIAPDDEVLAWRENVGQYAKEIDPKNGKPHRALRVRYAVRGFGMKSDGVTVIIMMMTRCLDELQGVKHGVDETKTIAAARRALLALENTLTALMPY
ncbi:hypothetical protein [Frankia sp. BMG5.23]|uniref:pPIWI-associating nuclease domain-containing protein n=1 Tax=Frankia sp. BMG5.23 TaxID=683305 RepID=UPI0034CF5B45